MSDCARLKRPVPVFLKRLAAPRRVFILGMTLGLLPQLRCIRLGSSFFALLLAAVLGLVQVLVVRVLVVRVLVVARGLALSPTALGFGCRS